MAALVRWVLNEGQDFTRELHYAKLPQRVRELAERKLVALAGAE